MFFNGFYCYFYVLNVLNVIFLIDNLYFLGLLKLYGITISKDVEGAAELFQKAAILGNPDAQTAIGMMKMKSLGNFFLFFLIFHFFFLLLLLF